MATYTVLGQGWAGAEESLHTLQKLHGDKETAGNQAGLVGRYW